MATGSDQREPEVIVTHHPSMMEIILNRPRVINALTTEMILQIRQALEEAMQEDRCQFVLFLGTGNRGFCAGGDLKRLAKAVREKSFSVADEFFREEYGLDLSIHRFPKPVIVLAEGITMGGGLGISAGADIVIATERTLMAMPETRIGFFPDVGATGWMFTKCPRGYPEYLGLVGYEMEGAECIRLGLATALTRGEQLPRLRKALQSFRGRLTDGKKIATEHLKSYLTSFFQGDIPVNPGMDAWIATHFAGKTSLPEIMDSLSRCSQEDRLCQDVYHRLSERSPTALVLTLALLRHNEGRPIEEVLAADTGTVRFIIRHPDYLEGIRARILDKDDLPHWRPSTVEEVALPEIRLTIGKSSL
ncbi:MAG TPA: enoyl-CoA hydratase/isomerase family protein [Thermodesulfobacteriota bacterium]|nr:enoyl-CoA hydratase/isomerase family protein [Thermodesulfobacteriota bacterium]